MTAIPILQTERLTLRPPTLGNFAAYAAFRASPRAQYMGGPQRRFAAWGMFCHDVACWTMFCHGALLIDLRSTGQCIALPPRP